MPVSNCSEFEQRLQQSVEARRPPEADLQAHAGACADCRRLWQQHALLETAVAAWNSSTSSECDVAEAVLARHAFADSTDQKDGASTAGGSHSHIGRGAATAGARAMSAAVDAKDGDVRRPADAPVLLKTDEEGQARAGGRRRESMAVLVVSALALLVIVGLFGRPPQQPSEVAGVESPILPSESSPVEADPDADVELLVRDAGSAYLELARGAAGIFTDTVALMPEQPLPRTLTPDVKLGPEGPERLLPTGQELEPVRRDVGRALDFLLKTMTADVEPTS